MADSRLAHCNVVVQCSESVQKIDNGKNRPQGVIEARMFQCLLSVKQHVKIDIETCRYCGRAVKMIASIEDAAVIQKILSHLRLVQPFPSAMALPQQARAPPLAGLPSCLA